MRGSFRDVCSIERKGRVKAFAPRMNRWQQSMFRKSVSVSRYRCMTGQLASISPSRSRESASASVQPIGFFSPQ